MKEDFSVEVNEVDSGETEEQHNALQHADEKLDKLEDEINRIKKEDEKRIKILWINPEMLLGLFSGEAVKVVVNALPEGARIKHLDYDLQRNSFGVVIQHHSFPISLLGSYPPDYPAPVVKRIDEPTNNPNN